MITQRQRLELYNLILYSLENFQFEGICSCIIHTLKYNHVDIDSLIELVKYKTIDNVFYWRNNHERITAVKQAIEDLLNENPHLKPNPKQLKLINEHTN